jgi:glycosyltransferase involved in cell wall biosynthesis
MNERLPSLSVVLPCRDEAPNVAQTVADAVRAARRAAAAFEVVVVDDGSRDETAEVTRALQRRFPELRLVRNRRSAGYGGALKRGFEAARMEWIFYTDGDGQFDLSQLTDLLPLLRDYDVVTGYRSPRRDSGMRTVTGLAWTALTNALLRVAVRDVNCAFKLLPRGMVERLELTSDGAAFSAELLAKARRLGYRIGEAPVRHRPRTAGKQSGADLRVILRALRELARLIGNDHLGPRPAPTPRSLP